MIEKLAEQAIKLFNHKTCSIERFSEKTLKPGTTTYVETYSEVYAGVPIMFQMASDKGRQRVAHLVNKNEEIYEAQIPRKKGSHEILIDHKTDLIVFEGEKYRVIADGYKTRPIYNYLFLKKADDLSSN